MQGMILSTSFILHCDLHLTTLEDGRPEAIGAIAMVHLKCEGSCLSASLGLLSAAARQCAHLGWEERGEKRLRQQTSKMHHAASLAFLVRLHFLKVP